MIERDRRFICIGAMKCGTTSLHEYLKNHKDVCMSSPKETNFFLGRNEKSVDWYKKRFTGKAEVYGEVSPNYAKYPFHKGVPERMHQLLPELKLIYLVRDPIERALSHYVWSRLRRDEVQSIDDAFRPVEECGYLILGKYYMQISKYLEYYDIDDIMVVESSKLDNETFKTMNSICNFVGVKAVGKNVIKFGDRYNVTSNRKKTTAAASFLTGTAVGRAMRDIGKHLVPDKVVDEAKALLWPDVDVEKPELSDSLLREVKEYLKEDIDRFRELTGKDLDNWSV